MSASAGAGGTAGDPPALEAGAGTGGGGGMIADAGDPIEVGDPSPVMDAGDPEAPPAGQISVTWTFKTCGDNGVSVGIIDQTTNKGLAGPIPMKKPQGNVFALFPVNFTCAPGDIVCWSASDKEGMCGACADGAMPLIGC